MPIKKFKEKTIEIRKISDKDLRDVKEFQNFINSVVEEDVMISNNKKMSLKEERVWLKNKLKAIKNQRAVFLIAKDKDRIVGTTQIESGHGRQDEVGILGITIAGGYRRIGLGKCLMKEIIRAAKKEIRPKPKIIRLSVFAGNKPAIALYEKFGFKKVAMIPKQFSYKEKLIDEIVMIKEL